MLITIIVFLAILFPSQIYAACLWNGNTATVASPYSASDVQACITDAAAKTGDVLIQIPNSTVTWSSGITVDMQSGWTNVTGLTIRGQDDCTTAHNSTPSFDYPTSCGTNIANFRLNYKGKEGKAFRLSNFRGTGSFGISLDGNGKSWRFDHIFMDNITGSIGGRVIWMTRSTQQGWLYEGLLDHNNIVNFNGEWIFQLPLYDGGNAEWMAGAQLGTSHAVYLENNRFIGGPTPYLTDNNAGSRWVIRYNYIQNCYLAGHDAIIINGRGSMKAEVYENVFHYTTSYNGYWIFFRVGSVGVFYNNTITKDAGADLANGIALAIYRTYQAGGDPWDALCGSTSGNAILDTVNNYPQQCSSGTGCIKMDGSASSPNGWPCRDQIGVSGNNPQVGGGNPFLIWNNTINGSPIGVEFGSSNPAYIVSNRDYCIHNTTLPATCNSIGTSTYWPGPYTYPHPLQVLPSPPKNLRIIQ